MQSPQFRKARRWRVGQIAHAKPGPLVWNYGGNGLYVWARGGLAWMFSYNGDLPIYRVEIGREYEVYNEHEVLARSVRLLYRVRRNSAEWKHLAADWQQLSN